MSVKPSSLPHRCQPADDTADAAATVALLISAAVNLKRVGPPQEIRDAVQRASLGKRHGRVLLAVGSAAPVSVTDLAERLGLLVSTTSTLVGELSRAGLLVRAEDEDDRRRTIVRLHDDYQDIMAAWLEVMLEPIRETLRLLSPDAREHLIHGLEVLSEQTSRSAAGRLDPDC